MAKDRRLRDSGDPSRARLRGWIEAEQAAVFGAAWRVLGDRAAAEDVTQELFMGLLEGRGDRGHPRSERGFLISRVIGLARTRLRSEARRRRREQEVARPEGDVDAPVSPAMLEEVRDAILALPEAPRTCVELRYFGGLSAREIAEQLGCADRTVHDRLRAGMDALRRRLSPRCTALLAPVLVGEGPPPAVDPSPGLEAELLSLVEGTAVAGVSGSPGLWGSLALVAVLLTSVSLGVDWLSSDGSGSEQDVQRSHGSPDSGEESLEGALMGLDVGMGSPSGDPRDSRRAIEEPEGVSRATGLRILVRGEGGEPVRGSTLEISARKLRTLSAILDLREGDIEPRVAGLLGAQVLRESSELEVTDLPASLCDLPFEVGALAPGFAASAPTEFVLVEGTTVEVEVLLPRPLRTRLVLFDAESEEAVEGARAFSITELERRGLEPGEVWRDAGPARAVSDVLGDAWLGGLGPGTHHVEVSAEGYGLVVLRECEAGAVVRVPMERAGPLGQIIATVRGPGGEAIVGFPVSLSPAAADSETRVLTDEEGRARFEGLRPDGYTVALPVDEFAELQVRRGYLRSPIHYVPHPLYEEVTEGETVEVDLGYVPGSSRWEVTVRDSVGVGVSDMEVTIHGPFQLGTRTDADGHCRFEHLPAGAWSLTVGDSFGGLDFGSRTLAVGELRHDAIDLGSARVSGTVFLGETGESPRRAFLSLRGPCTVSVISGSKGSFSFERVPPGDYRLRCHVPGYAGSRTSVRVGAEDVVEEVRLQRGGTISVDRSGAWCVPGSTLVLVEEGFEDYPLAEEHSERARVDFEHLRPGTYLLRAEAPGLEAVERRVVVRNLGTTSVTLD